MIPAKPNPYIGLVKNLFINQTVSKSIKTLNVLLISNIIKNFHLIKIVFYTIKKKKSTQYFIKILKEKKMSNLFQGSTENKLKALKIAEELADKSTLPIFENA